MSIKLPTSGSFNGAKVLATQTADLGSFNGTFQQHSKLSIKLLTSGSFDGAKFSSFKLLTSTVLKAHLKTASYWQESPSVIRHAAES